MPNLNLFQVLAALEEEPKTNAKLQILKDNKDTPYLKEVLLYAYNPRINFGITEIGSCVEVNQNNLFDDQVAYLLGLLNQLKNKYDLVNKSVRETVNLYVKSLDDQHRKLLQKILRRDLRIGMQATQINKVFKDLIPETPYMRCSTTKTVDITKWKDWDKGHYLQLKADGMFQRCIIQGDSISFVSRSGEVLPKGVIDWAESFLSQFGDDSEFTLEGELLVYDSLTQEYLHRKDGNGYINSLRQGGGKTLGLHLHYQVWDLTSEEGDDFKPYQERFIELEYMIQKINDVVRNPVSVIPTVLVTSPEQMAQHVTSWMDQGLEGGVLKHRDAIWKDGTSKQQVKLKKQFEVEVQVIGFKEGKAGTKRSSTFGSIEFKSSCGSLVGYVSGFTDKELKEINSNRQGYIGAIMTVQANDLIQDSEGNYSLSHPRFVEFRHDKVFADSLARIIEQSEAAKSNFFKKV